MNENFKIHRRMLICSCNLTAQDWQLFSNKPEIDLVARTLNRAVEVYAGGAGSKENFLQLTIPILEKLSDFGASDTEPRAVLDQLARELYGD